MSSELLLDTHPLLWWLGNAPALSAPARELIEDPANRILVSAASVWEIAIKRALGKLDVPDDTLDTIQSEGFELLDVSPQHAWAVRNLPNVPGHRDPFDRLLICQAQLDRLEIISADAEFDHYNVTRRW